MAQIINLFQTISKYQSPLTQSPATITCLVQILEYLDLRLTDDTANDLMLLITDHLNSSNTPYPHYINMATISTEFIDMIYRDMVASQKYTGSREDFVKWLTITIDFYDADDVNQDLLGVGLTLGYAIQLIGYHNDSLIVHPTGLSAELDAFVPSDEAVPVFSANSYATFKYRKCRQVKLATYDLLLQRTLAFLTPPPVDPVLNIDEYEDLAKDVMSDQMAIDLGIPGYADPFILDYEDIMTNVWNKRLDYYTNHLDYALSSDMDAAYRTTISNLRSSVNTYYSKVFDMYTKLFSDDFSILVDLNIQKNATRTLDIMNLTGLSKSQVAIAYESYWTGTGNSNRIVAYFDNFNPMYTRVLLDNISADNPVDIRIACICDKDIYKIVWSYGEMRDVVEFPHIGRFYVQDPRFLFVPPKVKWPRKDTIRLRTIEAYNSALTDEQALFCIRNLKLRN